MPEIVPGLVAERVCFSYVADEQVLDDVSLVVRRGDSVSITGPSGAGKSSLLLCLGGLLSPTSGRVSVDGTELAALHGDDLVRFRRRTFGFVFQQSLLVPELCLVDNVALPLLADGVGRGDALRAARDQLERFDIGHVADKIPNRVSGGQAQRAAVARALIHRPPYLLADEPTGALDSTNADTVIEALLSCGQDTTVVIVTHNPTIARRTDHQLSVLDGRLTVRAS